MIFVVQKFDGFNWFDNHPGHIRDDIDALKQYVDDCNEIYPGRWRLIEREEKTVWDSETFNIISAVRESIEKNVPINLSISPGSASPEDIRNLLDAINHLHIVCGGHGLVFKVTK